MKNIVLTPFLTSIFAILSLISQGALAKNSFPDLWEVGNEKLFVFDPKMLAWAAYDEYGFLVKTGDASGGRDYCEDIDSACRTPVGYFRVYSKGKENCKSSKFPLETDGGAPMPYCMFFKGGYAIHGSNDVPGYNASHGCVRVVLDDAEWLSKNFIQIRTRVRVLSYP